MILSICNNPDILEIFRIIKIFILIIRIVVPILLILSVMIAYFKSVMSSDNDSLKLTNKNVISKIIAAILIFFIPTFVSILGNISSSDNAYKSCINMSTKEGISELRYDIAKKTVDRAYETINTGDYNIALSNINKIKDPGIKASLEEKMKTIREYLDLKNEIVSLSSLSKKEMKTKYKELYSKIEAIQDERIKTMMMELLEEYGSGKLLDVEVGLHLNKKYGNMSYYEVVPPNPTTNMALWIFLHGDGGQTTGGFTNYVSSGKAYKNEEFFYIAPSPIPFRQDWSGGSIPSDLKSLIDHLVEEYQIDEDRIIISGFSRGAIGTWTMVNKYPNLFSVAYPVSCRPVGVQANNFLTTVVRAHAGDVYGKRGNYEGEYADDMNALVNNIKKLGGDATMTIHHGKKHGEVNYILQEQETIDFALSVIKKR